MVDLSDSLKNSKCVRHNQQRRVGTNNAVNSYSNINNATRYVCVVIKVYLHAIKPHRLAVSIVCATAHAQANNGSSKSTVDLRFECGCVCVALLEDAARHAVVFASIFITPAHDSGDRIDLLPSPHALPSPIEGKFRQIWREIKRCARRPFHPCASRFSKAYPGKAEFRQRQQQARNHEKGNVH